jgi:uncharacterized protein (DUF58 family)
VLVFPALSPVPTHLLHRSSVGGAVAARRRGRGSDLHNLRDYRAGDDLRLVHWKSSAKTGTLTVRELEAETTLDTRIVLEGGGDPARLEETISDAASLAAHLLRAGAQVELAGHNLWVPPGRGPVQRRRALTALALWEPAAATPEAVAPPLRHGVRVIRVGLG